MNKEKFIKMLNDAKEDEYGRLYVLGDFDNKIYFGTITTICEDLFNMTNDKTTANIYDRHFWNDDTLECYVVSTKHNESIKYKQPKRIKELAIIYSGNNEDEIMKNRYKINELIKEFNRYECLLEKEYEDD